MKRQVNCKDKILSNNKGFTLAEVMVSFVILMLASQLLFSGTIAAERMEKKAKERSAIGDMLDVFLYDETKTVSGTLRLEMNGNDLSADAKLYRYEEENKLLKLEAIRLEEPLKVEFMEEIE